MDAVATQKKVVSGRYKIINRRTDRFGNNEILFVGESGGAFRLPIVGRVWAPSEHMGGGWAGRDTVVDSKAYGLLRFTSFRSRFTRTLELAEGEVYLPMEKTGAATFLKSLPE